MIFDLKKLKSQGKFRTEFRCEFAPDPEIIELPNAAFRGKAVVSGTLDIAEKSVYVDAEVEAEIAGECSRCLDEAVCRISVPLAEKFSERKEEDGYTYSRGELDLTEAATEALALGMPRRILCREDCKGLCPGCGANLNRESCRCGN